MSVVAYVNKPEGEPWCVPGLLKCENQFLILDRCTLFVSEPLSDCLEGVTQISSLEVVGFFEGLSQAMRSFERLFEYQPQLEFARSKPRAFTSARTVEIRDWCGEGV